MRVRSRSGFCDVRIGGLMSYSWSSHRFCCAAGPWLRHAGRVLASSGGGWGGWGSSQRALSRRHDPVGSMSQGPHLSRQAWHSRSGSLRCNQRQSRGGILPHNHEIIPMLLLLLLCFYTACLWLCFFVVTGGDLSAAHCHRMWTGFLSLRNVVPLCDISVLLMWPPTWDS